MSRCPRTPRKSDGQAGFSLIEMLVAIVILAMVVAFLPGTFRLAHRTWDATVVLDREASMDGGRNFVQARLAEAMPIFEQGKSGSVTIAFTGANEVLSFIAPSQNGPDGGSLYRFTLDTKPTNGAHKALIVTLSRYLPVSSGGNPESKAEEHVLFDNVVSAEFRYFGRKELRAASSWHVEWTRRDALPDLVALHVMGGGASALVHTMIVELRLRKKP